jgi:hypothetical protein
LPHLRCSICENESTEASSLAIGAECLECEEGEMLEIDLDEEPQSVEPLVKTTVGSAPQLGAAREAARALLKERRVARPPVDVEQIARARGLRIVERRGLGSLSGRLVDSTVELAPCSRHRRRFVVAHELGHHELRKPHGSGAHVEPEVNAFAGELLVPGPFLLSELKQVTEIERLKQRFDVSGQVLRIAASNHRVGERLTGSG